MHQTPGNAAFNEFRRRSAAPNDRAFVKTSLAQDMADEVSVRRSAGAPDMEIAYPWHIQTKDGNSIIWHNGGTGGYPADLERLWRVCRRTATPAGQTNQ